MKFFAITVASLATLAAAAPNKPAKCTPATYRCSSNAHGPSWDTCNTSGEWVFSGNCPPDTVCKFFKPSKSPYCVPPDFQFP